VIHFVVTEKGSFSIRGYLKEDGIALAGRMRVVLYKELAHMRRLPLGTWVFTEPDQLDAPRRELATLVAERLTAAGPGVRILNDPRQVRLRAELLGAAHAVGINEHRAWPATDVPLESVRYPVFVRFANQHIGNLTPVLHSPPSLADALASLAADGMPRDELLVVEFADTKDDNGIYRKYSAYNVGGRIIAKALEQSRDWMVKWDYRVFDRQRADEELAYCEANPDEEWIREMFRLARIDYGRIDYGMLHGKPQLWEINTNPTIGRGPNRERVRRPEVIEYKKMIASGRAAFYERFVEAWAAVDTPVDGASIDATIPQSIVRSIDRAERQRRMAERMGSLLDVVARQRWMRPMTRAAKHALAPILAARLRALR
jgi:hypothetical protein